VRHDDPELGRLRRACSEQEWAEAGFAHVDGPVYGLRLNGLMVAAGNMTGYRGMPADVGVITLPAFRGRGLARQLVSHMTAEHLAAVGVVRHRALQTNLPSLAVASSLGFIGRGENLAVRLEPA
jgi:GNAT superfamily N-acetyltransferase